MELSRDSTQERCSPGMQCVVRSTEGQPGRERGVDRYSQGSITGRWVQSPPCSQPLAVLTLGGGWELTASLGRAPERRGPLLDLEGGP